MLETWGWRICCRVWPISSVMRNHKRNFTVCVQTYFTGKSTLKNLILQKKNLKSRSRSTNMKSPFKGFYFLHFLCSMRRTKQLIRIKIRRLVCKWSVRIREAGEGG